MKIGVFAFFLKKYPDAQHEARKQIESLVIVLLSLAFVTTAATLVITTGYTRYFTAGMALLFLILLGFIKAGAAVRVNVIAGILVSLSFSAVPLALQYRMSYEIYLMAALNCASIVVAAFIARKAWQVLASLGIGILGLFIDFFIRILPSALAAGGDIGADDLVIAIFTTGIAAGFSFLTMRRSQRLLEAAEEESNRGLEQILMLQRAIAAVQDNLNLGGKLLKSASAVDAELGKMRSEVVNADKSLAQLAGRADDLEKTIQAMENFARGAGESSESQSSVVNEVSAAVVEMTESIRNIARISVERKDSINKLSASTANGMAEVAATSASVKDMEEKSSSILDIVKVISAVAARTNLLAMNAAIEAAHAGDYGRGFSVVADEIRALSEQPGQNVKQASLAMKGAMTAIYAVSAANSRTQAIFSKMADESKTVSDAMAEIAQAMSEMSAGTQEIMNGIGASVNSTNGLRSLISEVEGKVEISASALKELKIARGSVYAAIQEVAGRFSSLAAEAQAVNDAGKANDEALRRLSEALTLG